MRLAGQRSVAEATDTDSGGIEKDCSEGEGFRNLGAFLYFLSFHSFNLKQINIILLLLFNAVKKCHRFMTLKNCHKFGQSENFHLFPPKMGILTICDSFFVLLLIWNVYKCHRMSFFL